MLPCRVALMGLALAVTGCVPGREPTPTPVPAATPVAAVHMPTNTPEPTATPSPTKSPRPEAAAALPADPEQVVVQFARIEHRPWEPDILAQMTPNFSLQGKGFLVYQYAGGPSLDGWYQTVITATQVAEFVHTLVDDIGVLDIAQRRGEPKLSFATKPDGTPAGTPAVGVIYVQTADESGRLVLTADDFTNPKGPDAERIRKLTELITYLELWRQGTERVYTPEQRAAIAGVLGWWTDPRLPFTPESGVAFGTRARRHIPTDAPAAVWPLAESPASTFDADFGAKPVELKLTGQDFADVFRAQRERAASAWGPLWAWHDPNNPTRSDPAQFLIGVRPGVPGANNMVLDYTYQVPKRGTDIEQE